MKYYSTRQINKAEGKTASYVIKNGIAADGGLYIPESFPPIDGKYISALTKKSYAKRAADILSLFLTDFSAAELEKITAAAYSKENFPDGATVISSVGKQKRFLELWHGPTCAFKDMALQILPYLLTYSLEKQNSKSNALILVATSGDTGKAALEGFRDVDRTFVIVLYPSEGVSRVQKLQMTTQAGKNVHVLAVDGNFDDAQNAVKQIFADKALIDYFADGGNFLSSANSINWGRLAPQIVYYISAYCDLVKNREIENGDIVDVCVPTGNFGNILAAYIAKKMGLPLGKLICASNSNNVLTDFFKTGVYDRNRKFHMTISPSMDILISSNLERLLYFVCGSTKCADYMKQLSETGKYQLDERDMAIINEDFEAIYCGEDDTKKTIADLFGKYSYVCDPHTAVAAFAAGEYIKKTGSDKKIIVVSTASPYKFAAAVCESIGIENIGDEFELIAKLSQATGQKVPPSIENLASLDILFKQTTHINNIKEAIKSIVGNI